jgi:hypothetical protein
MGAYFYYVNHTKREFFSIAALGGGMKHAAIGRTLAARAFELMLISQTGRWANDQVELIADDWDRRWEGINETYLDIVANAVLKIFDTDKLEDLGPAADANDDLYMQLCYLAVTHQSEGLEEALKSHFGPGYLRRYKTACENCLPRTVVKDLVPRTH